MITPPNDVVYVQLCCTFPTLMDASYPPPRTRGNQDNLTRRGSGQDKRQARGTQKCMMPIEYLCIVVSVLLLFRFTCLRALLTSHKSGRIGCGGGGGGGIGGDTGHVSMVQSPMSYPWFPLLPPLPEDLGQYYVCRLRLRGTPSSKPVRLSCDLFFIGACISW